MTDRDVKDRRRRVVTSADVARAAGVSRSTVSLVLNNVPGMTFHPETVRRVRLAAERLGYFPNVPARSVTTRQGYALGVVSFWEPGSTLFARTFQGMLAASREAGYGLTLCDIASPSGEFDVDVIIQFYREGRIDGVVALLSTFPAHAGAGVLVRRLKSERIPFVLINSAVEDPEVDEILADNRHAGYIGTKHLLELGHTRIGFGLRRGQKGEISVSEAERFEGYTRALAEAELQVDERLILSDPEGPTHINVDSGHRSFDALADRLAREGAPLPTAVYCINDRVALGVLYAAGERGLRVPDDLAIVGTDDLEIASQVRPALTSVRQPLHELGVEAIRLLLDRIKGSGPEGPVKLRIPCSLKVRASCGTPRH